MHHNNASLLLVLAATLASGCDSSSDANGAPSGGGSVNATVPTGNGGAVANGGASTASSTQSGTGGASTAATTTTSVSTTTNGCQEADCGSHKWACWKIPTPPSLNLPNPQSHTDLGNGTVRDNVTCLLWEQSPASTLTNWQGQFDRCAALNTTTFGGYSDWRLPTRMEMASITDITSGGFPKVFAVPKGYYATGSHWYKTILVADPTSVNMAWGYGTNGFTSNAIVMSEVNVVSRCVRGNGAGEAPGAYAVEPTNHYTIANGEVTDNYTDRIWQQGYSPSLMTHEQAATYCSTLSLNGNAGWRLPALSELASTVNEAKVGGAIVDSAFPNNPNGCKDPKYWFWAAEAYGASNAWGLSYCDGFTGWNAGASGTWNYFPTANVRCVR